MNLPEKLAGLKLPFVRGEGPERARLVILGEALGETEVKESRPFVGKAGWMLDDICRGAKVQRREAWVMNVIPTQPPGNRVGRLEELGITLAECVEWMKGEIQRIQPNCILALGAVPLQALTGYRDITDWRGSIVEATGIGERIKVVSTFHPSYIMRMAEKTAKKERESQGSVKHTYGSARLSAVLDTVRAFAEARSRELVRPQRTLVTQPSLKTVREALMELMAKPQVSFDVETMGRWVDCVGFSGDPNWAICIPRGEKFWGAEAKEVDSLLRQFLWEHPGLVAQNGNFDLTMLMGNGLPVRKLHFDTMVSHHFLWPELPHDLHYLTSIYTKEPYYKWMLRASKGDLDMRWRYNCLDCTVTVEIAKALDDEMKELGVDADFYGYVMPLLHTVLKMGLRGVVIDLEWKKRVQVALAWLIRRAKKKALVVLEKPLLNLGSPKQVQEYLYKELKLPVQINRDTGRPTCDADAIGRLAKRPGMQKLKSILAVRDVEKKKSTYADVEVYQSGRLTTSYGVTGTETGRLNSKTDLFKHGWNSQNPPKWFRRVVVPEKGCVILEGDLKFAEAMLIAWFARDAATIGAVRSGADIYRWHASRMLGKEMEEISGAERNMVKPVILGCGYGLGPGHMFEMMEYTEKTTPDGRIKLIPTGITRKRAAELRELFFKSCPAIGEYQAEVRKALQTTRTLRTPFNRRRVFLGRMNDEMYRKGYAFLPQSTCVEYMNRGMVRCGIRFSESVELWLQVHDAMVVQCPLELEPEVMRIMVEELAVPVVINGEALVIPLEIKRSTESWGQMKEVGVFNR